MAPSRQFAAFGCTAAYRTLVTTGGGRALRAQFLMLAVVTILFAPMLAAGRGPMVTSRCMRGT